MTTQVEKFFARRDRFGNGRALYVVAALAFLLPLSLSALRDITMDNEVERWLPEDDREAQVLAWYRENFNDDEQLLVTWNGSSLRDPRIEALRVALEGTPDNLGIRRGGTELVTSVLTPHEVLARMIDAHVDPAVAVQRLQGTLIGQGPLRVRLSEGQSVETAGATVQAIAQRTLGRAVHVGPPAYGAELRFETDIDEDSDVADIVDSELVEEITNLPLHSLSLSWNQLNPTVDESLLVREALSDSSLVEDSFFHAGSPVAMVVTISETGLAERPALIEFIKETAETVGIDRNELYLGGSAAASVALNQGARTSSWNTKYPIWNLPFRSPFLTSAIIGAVIALIALKSIRLGVLVLGVSYATTLMAVACIPVAGDSLNMVLVVMPTLLTVLTLSGAIHVANYWRHEANESVHGAVGRAVKQAWAPCLLASGTTAVGLLSLLNSTLTPVRQFGMYSAIGCGFAFFMVLFGLPSLLQIWRGQGTPGGSADEKRWTNFGRGLSRVWGPVAVLCVAAGGIASAGLMYFATETKVIRYFPNDAAIVRDYHAIESQLAGITPLDVVVRFDADAQAETDFVERMEIVRAAAMAVSDHSEVTGTLCLADFQPIAERPDADASTFQKIRFRQRIRRIEQEAKSGKASTFLAIADQEANLRGTDGELLAQTGDELWRISAQASLMSDADYGQLMADLDERVSTTIEGVTGSRHVVTGMVPVFFRTQQAVLESLIRSFGLAFVLIAFVLMVLLRSIPAGLIAMIPNLLPVGVVFGLVSWAGQRIDIGTMITASVALGVAVDGTLHLITWFRRGLDAGHGRHEAMARALGHCGPAMWQTSAAVGLCLLALMPAELLLISRFGWLMAALILAALVADVILLPSLLAGPLGYLLDRRQKATSKPSVTTLDVADRRPSRQKIARPRYAVAQPESNSIDRRSA